MKQEKEWTCYEYKNRIELFDKIYSYFRQHNFPVEWSREYVNDVEEMNDDDDVMQAVWRLELGITERPGEGRGETYELVAYYGEPIEWKNWQDTLSFIGFEVKGDEKAKKVCLREIRPHIKLPGKPWKIKRPLLIWSSFLSHALSRAYKQEKENKLLPSPDIDLQGVKNKKQLVERLAKYCGDNKTPLQSEFEEMTFRDLKQLRHLGAECYTLTELYQMLKEANEANRPLRDPLTRKVWSEPLKNMIFKQYKEYVDKKVQAMQKPHLDFKENDVQLRIEPEEIKGQIFYHVSIYFVPLNQRMDLGYIPEYTNPRDVSENTGVLLASLRELWDLRRLLLVHNPIEAITCCSVHLRKPPSYWIESNGTVNGSLVHSMIQEMRDKLG